MDDAPVSALWMPGHAAAFVDRIEKELSEASATALPELVATPGVEPPD